MGNGNFIPIFATFDLTELLQNVCQPLAAAENDVDFPNAGGFAHKPLSLSLSLANSLLIWSTCHSNWQEPGA